MTHRVSVRRLLTLIVSLAALLAAGLAVASAEGENDQPETFVTRLEPGDNLVGWTTGAAPVEELFKAVPRIQHIWAWDSSWRRWRFASPHLSKHMWTLLRLTPGMGLQVRIEGRESVDWARPRRPAQGTVELKPGWNLVAWNGRDEAPLNRVIRGIGRALTHAGYLPRDSQQTKIFARRTIEVSDEPGQVDFGSALWINVGRSVYWLQPTGQLPEIIFAGDVPRETRQQARGAMRQAIELTWEHFGLEADFSRYKVFFAQDLDSYVDVFNANLPEGLGPIAKSRTTEGLFDIVGGLANASSFVVQTRSWASKASLTPWESSGKHVTSGMSTTMHEYTHIIQKQLIGNFDNDPAYVVIDVPGWTTEGMARWMQYLQLQFHGLSWDEVSDRASRIARGLSELSRGLSHGDEYPVGAAAAFALSPQYTNDSMFELYRQLAPNDVGPSRQWYSWSDWSTAFANTFGITEESFYNQFNSSRESAAVAKEVDHDRGVEPPGLTVRVIDTRRSADIETVRVSLRDWTGSQGYTTSNVAVGHPVSFLLEADRQYSVAVEFGKPSCLGIWSQGGLVGSIEQADLLEAHRNSKFDLELDLSDEPCPHVVRGKLVSSSGVAVAGIRVIFDDDGGVAERQGLPGQLKPATLTRMDGTFEFPVPAGGAGVVQAELTPSCFVREQVKGAARTRARSTVVSIVDDACGQDIPGIVLGFDGAPLANVPVSVSTGSQGHSVWTDATGRFTMNAPFSLESVPVRFLVRIDGCHLYYEDGGVTGLYQAASLIDASEAAFRGIEFRVPKGVCEHRVSGKLLDSDGTPVSGQWVHFSGSAGEGAGGTGADGTFSSAVPGNGSYRVWIWNDRCTIYRGSRGPTKNWDSAGQVRVSNADVTGIEFRLPEDPSSFCN